MLEEVTLDRTGSGALTPSEVNDTINQNAEIVTQATRKGEPVTIPGDGAMSGTSIVTPVGRGTTVNSSQINNSLADKSKELANGASATLVPTNGTLGVTNESRRFTKKQLEEARLANMRKNGRVCTKKTLFESEGEPEFDLGELVDFCQNNDFFIYIQVPMKGWAPIVINTQEGLRDEISSDIYNTRPTSFSNEMTDEILQTLSGKIGDLRGIVKVMGTAEDGSKYPYYIVWEN